MASESATENRAKALALGAIIRTERTAWGDAMRLALSDPTINQEGVDPDSPMIRSAQYAMALDAAAGIFHACNLFRAHLNLPLMDHATAYPKPDAVDAILDHPAFGENNDAD
jgi:hypothetical protein